MKRIILSDKQKYEAQKILSAFKTYSAFIRDKTAAYKFTNIIGIKICPYCNIQYVYTVYTKNGEPVIRPDIDHFIPKNDKTGKSHLQLELTNLIPACSVCNERLKRELPFSRATNIHPYFDDFDSIMCFRININDSNYLDEESFEITLEQKDDVNTSDVERALENISDFKLLERYQFHKNEVVILFKRIKSYNKAKKIEIEKLMSASGEKYRELDYLFPEKYCEINSTSLGKLKRDILDNLLLQ